MTGFLAFAAESGTLGIGLAFWIIFLVGVIFGFAGRSWSNYYYGIGVWAIVEIFLLGWQVFGFPIGK